MEERLANEILDAANNAGASVRNVKTLIKWQKLTKHLLITVGRIQRKINVSINRFICRLWKCGEGECLSFHQALVLHNESTGHTDMCNNIKWLLLLKIKIQSIYGRSKTPNGKRVLFRKHS